MNRYISIGEGSVMVGVSVQTLRRWDKEGKFSCDGTAAGLFILPITLGAGHLPDIGK